MSKAPPQILIVSSFPPTHCGIGAYAAQEAISLRRSGSVVHTLCLSADGAGTYRVNLASISSIIRLLLVLSLVRLDQVRIHYVDSFLPAAGSGWRANCVQLLQWSLWTYLGLRAHLTVVVHEFSPVAAFGDRARWSRTHLFACAHSIEFHTAIERMQFEKSLPHTTRKNQVVAHMRHFVKAFEGSQQEARAHLGLPADRRIFLCLGFIQPHKGFDLAIRSFAESQPPAAELYVVGSVRHETPANFAYRDALVAQARDTSNVYVVDRFVDNESFDAWICAADMVILPYAEIWTSGVLARAMLYGRRVAMRDHATLREQVLDYPAAMFSGERDLAAIMRRAARLETPSEVADHVAPKRPRVLVVAPLYGPTHAGGAERVIGHFTELLSHTCQVEVWSTRSSRLEGRDNIVHDEQPGGQFRVRRFATNVRAEPLFRAAHRRVAQGKRGSLWQWLWARTSISGIGMRKALRKSHGDFDVILLPHYFYGSTHRLAAIAPAKTILHPFLHDEPALRSRVIARLFGAPALVTHNSEAERIVAKAQLGLPIFRSHVIGNVVAGPPPGIELLQSPSSLPDAAPYLLFIGRMIEEKNVGLLARWFLAARLALPAGVRLVMVGEGPATVPEFADPAIVRLQRVSEEEKWRLLSHCIALVQPSILESFSLVTLEAWHAGRPVIVHADCKATALHVEASGGGFAVRDAEAFSRAARTLLNEPDSARQMASRGGDYVRTLYSETAVRSRLEKAIDMIVQGTKAPHAGSPALRREKQPGMLVERVRMTRRWAAAIPAPRVGRPK